MPDAAEVTYQSRDISTTNYFPFFVDQLSSLFEAHVLKRSEQDEFISSDLFRVLDRQLPSVEQYNFFHHVARQVITIGTEEQLATAAINRALQILRLKIKGYRNNFGLQDELNMTPFTWNKFLQSSMVYNANPRLAVLGALAMTLPGPGQFGSVFTNYAQEEEIDVDQQPLRQWNNPPMSIQTFTNVKAKELYEQIFNHLFRLNTNVSIVDIAPILEPMPNYVNDRKYSVMFRHTVFTQTRQTQRLQGPASSYLNALPRFLSAKNYFGKMLGGRLLQVMEVMYHNTLRCGRFRDNWDKLAEVYSSRSPLLPFALKEANDTHRHPRVEDFDKGSLSFLPIFGSGNLFFQATRGE